MAKVHYYKLKKILHRLLDRKKMSITELARATDLPITTLHRISSGTSTRPYRKSLRPIADYFSLTIDQLTGEKPINNEGETNKTLPITKNLIEIPLITWEEIDFSDKNSVSKGTVITTNDMSKDCFALLMNDSSMEPTFLEGSILVFDPNTQEYDRCYALVNLFGQQVHVFRQIIKDANYKFLKPLNPDLIASQMYLMKALDAIIGVLVESRQAFGKK
jgi:SOS-response transcriptional repressor LexA